MKFNKETVDVIIDEDEKYPEYYLQKLEDCSTSYKNSSGFAYIVKIRGITKLPLHIYKRLIKAQKELELAENEMNTWLEKNCDKNEVIE